jgi:hypothetical protein
VQTSVTFKCVTFSPEYLKYYDIGGICSLDSDQEAELPGGARPSTPTPSSISGKLDKMKISEDSASAPRLEIKRTAPMTLRVAETAILAGNLAVAIVEYCERENASLAR